ncbi:MAG: isopentenyl-diphosphate Delta-isomerase [Bacteroidetes bacterium]|nr:isopentenyl-diphosphate Delta-isomerase [Bacteroidota bacterium]
MEEQVILIDENDVQIGLCGKLLAHESGQLHRAISVFIFNQKNEMLLQRRAQTKYHSGGLWTNACCSHPRPGESIEKAAQRRLKEEMGIEADSLFYAFHFIYKAKLDKGLTEHELDHVFIGKTDEQPKPDPAEVCEYKYLSVEEIKEDLKQHPEKYTYWFKRIFEKVISAYFQ